MHHTAVEGIAAGMEVVGRRVVDWEAAVRTGPGEGGVAVHTALADAGRVVVVHSYPEEDQVADHTGLVEDQAVVRIAQAGEHRGRVGSDTVRDVAGLGEDTETGPVEGRRIVEEDTGLADLAGLGTVPQEAVVVRTRSTAVVLAVLAEVALVDNRAPRLEEVPGRMEVAEGSCREFEMLADV